MRARNHQVDLASTHGGKQGHSSDAKRDLKSGNRQVNQVEYDSEDERECL